MRPDEHIALMAAAIRTYNGQGFQHSVLHANPNPIDEVAILFADEAQLEDWLDNYADKDHMLEHYRSERDQMMRLDVRYRETWNVRFEFLHVTIREHQENPWRIEAMVVLDGKAPLHQAMTAACQGRPAIIHASYKLPDSPTYAEECLRLWDEGMHSHATYMNSYGMFSYWHGEQDQRPLTNVLLKPRVNLRDSPEFRQSW